VGGTGGSGARLAGEAGHVLGRVPARCKEERDDHELGDPLRREGRDGLVDGRTRGLLVCVRDQDIVAERGLQRCGHVDDHAVRGLDAAPMIDQEDSSHTEKLACPRRERDAGSMRASRFWVLGGVTLAIATGCPPGETVPDSSVEVMGIDAPEPSDAAAPFDAPRRRDAGYDSGASCDLDGSGDAGEVARCNGHPELCDRRYDEVAVVMTHNAMSSEEDGFVSPNQNRRLWRQLEDGVRGFMLDVHVGRDGSVLLCHGLCALGQRPLADGLRDLRIFLGGPPAGGVSRWCGWNAAEVQVAEGLAAGGRDRYVYPPAGSPGPSVAWPTLREMIAGNERVVVFTADRDRTLPWHLYTYDWAWENPYAATTPAELSCAEDRGNRDRSLWVFNHFLTAPVASPELAEMINHDPSFATRVEDCRSEAGGDLPNFVTVDFYDLGDVFAVVDALNGVAL